MKISYCLYITRGDLVLFVLHRNQSGEVSLRVPAKFLDDGEMPRAAVAQLVMETTGLHPAELSSCGTLFFRPPRSADINVSVWTYRVPPHAQLDLPSDRYVWLPVSPELSPEIPALDRQWLPHILQRKHFSARVSYHPDGRLDNVFVYPRLPSPDKP